MTCWTRPGALFTSHALEYAPEKLGSDFRFIKYFGQYFYYRALRKPSEEDNGLTRPRWVYAVGVRAGLAKTFKGEVLNSTGTFFCRRRDDGTRF